MTGELPTASHCCHAFQGLKNVGGRSGKGRELGLLGLLYKPALACEGGILHFCGMGTAGSRLSGGMVLLKMQGKHVARGDFCLICFVAF